jgi:hypothetical protein
VKSGNFSQHRPWSRGAAAELLDMSGGLPGFEDIGAKQLDAAVALHRMLLTHGVAYLADEVGMGKTYVALATVALFRHLQPGFRVLYLAPSKNVLRKWHDRELPAFIRNNVRHADMRVRGADGTSPARSAPCMKVDTWLKCAVDDPGVLDVFVPFSALSFQLYGTPDNWYERVKELAACGDAWVCLTGVREKRKFKEKAAEVVNQTIPYYDLVVIDEAHLLKGGAGTTASDRAQFLARALGSNRYGGTRRFGAALLLSGTPFDRDLLQLARQFEIFASPKQKNAPHEAIAALAARKREGEAWGEIQAGLKPYLIRRVQKLKVGGEDLSRNQYRVERRAEAGISLAKDTSASALQQRIFTAVVQKRLIEHLDGANEGRFPLAMFSSWEAYSPPKRDAAEQTAAVTPPDDGEEDGHDGTPLPASDDALDTGRDDTAPRDARALDGALMEDVVGSYREVFKKEPPHPKLEAETARLHAEAFGEGLKQLVFVRRLKSVDDLYRRLNEAYDKWLGDYLRDGGMPGCPENLLAALAVARATRKTAARSGPSARAAAGNNSEEPPGHGDTLFSWFFRGKLDNPGKKFLEAQAQVLPPPSLLRERLRDPARMESIIGELDWRGFVTAYYPNLPEIPVQALADRASRLAGPTTALMRYRRLQLAWAQLQAERLPDDQARPFHELKGHLSSLVYGSGTDESDRVELKTANILLRVPTVALRLYRQGLGGTFLPAWEETWRALNAGAQGVNHALGRYKHAANHALAGSSRLESLDLQREVLFALLRLDHPFIDLYLGWLGAKRDDGHESAGCLVKRIAEVCARDPHGTRFGTSSILRNLADAWEQIAKTNFADLLKVADRIERRGWRQAIQQQLTPFAPVEWASGQNTAARSAIARRFRMPGYPMVLVSTSVLQEGEDLHVCCDRVTHFGISGSPIGIEQKNGRVDRIGSRAQRRLHAGRTVEEAGIRVNFPHLSESLEWYQIRDLSLSINDYLRSIHDVGVPAAADDIRLAQTMADRTPIPALLRDPLHSPFEPERSEAAGDVSRREVLRHIADAARGAFDRDASE